MILRQIKQSNIKQNRNYLNQKSIKGTASAIFDCYLSIKFSRVLQGPKPQVEPIVISPPKNSYGNFVFFLKFFPSSHDTAPTQQKNLPWLKLFENRNFFREKKDFLDYLVIS